MQFGEITEEAALAVAKAVKHKDQLEKLDLNGDTPFLLQRSEPPSVLFLYK